MYFLLIGCAYVEKTIYSQQARQDRTCLLDIGEYSHRYYRHSADDFAGGLSVRQVSASSF